MIYDAYALTGNKYVRVWNRTTGEQLTPICYADDATGRYCRYVLGHDGKLQIGHDKRIKTEWRTAPLHIECRTPHVMWHRLQHACCGWWYGVGIDCSRSLPPFRRWEEFWNRVRAALWRRMQAPLQHPDEIA